MIKMRLILYSLLGALTLYLLLRLAFWCATPVIHYVQLENGDFIHSQYERQFFRLVPCGYWYVEDSAKNLRAAYFYKRGLLEGNNLQYYLNGNIFVLTSYEKGKRHGAYFKFYENGDTAIVGQFKFDKPDSLWRWLDTSGRLDTVIAYEAD